MDQAAIVSTIHQESRNNLHHHQCVTSGGGGAGGRGRGWKGRRWSREEGEERRGREGGRGSRVVKQLRDVGFLCFSLWLLARRNTVTLPAVPPLRLLPLPSTQTPYHHLHLAPNIPSVLPLPPISLPNTPHLYYPHFPWHKCTVECNLKASPWNV